MIKEVYIFSLPVYPIRRDVCREKLIGQGVSADQIQVFECFYDMDYEQVSTICQEAVAEGFTFFESFFTEVDHHEHQVARCNTLNAMHISQSRNYCRFLKMVMEKDAPVMLIQDRRELVRPFSEVQALISDLESADPDWQYLSLSSDNGIDDYFDSEEKLRWDSPLTFFEADDQFLCGAGSSNDWGEVITPDGAEVLLEKFGKYLEVITEHCCFEHFMLRDMWDQPHIYSLADRAVDWADKERFVSSRDDRVYGDDA